MFFHLQKKVGLLELTLAIIRNTNQEALIVENRSTLLMEGKKTGINYFAGGHWSSLPEWCFILGTSSEWKMWCWSLSWALAMYRQLVNLHPWRDYVAMFSRTYWIILIWWWLCISLFRKSSRTFIQSKRTMIHLINICCDLLRRRISRDIFLINLIIESYHSRKIEQGNV